MKAFSDMTSSGHTVQDTEREATCVAQSGSSISSSEAEAGWPIAQCKNWPTLMRVQVNRICEFGSHQV